MLDKITSALGDDGSSSDDDAEEQSAEPIEPEEAGYTYEDVEDATGGGGKEYENGNVINDIDKLHKDFVAPSYMEVEAEAIRSGQDWVQSLYVDSWPENLKDGFINAVFQDSTFASDITIHLEPRSQDMAQSQLKDRIGTIEAEYEERKKQGASAEARDVKQKLDITRQMYDLVSRHGMSLFDVGMYANHRSDSPEQLNNQLSDFRGLLERPPANTDTRVATRRQDKGMVSASPIGHDELGKKNPMLGGGVATMMPFSSSSLIEENGVDFGVQPTNGSPIIVNRFDRNTGYNMMTIGNIGSGKSFSTKLNLVRTLQRRSDIDVVMLDPLEGFIGVNEALNGDRIVVGGNLGLNPLEIQETPAHILEQAGDGLDPYAAKLKDVMAFFENFFGMRGDHLDDSRRGVLEKAVQKAYADAEITRNPDTHGKESPTLDDVMDNLEEMAQQPEKYTRSSAEQEQESISKFASNLLVGMQPFSPGGEFENLTQETEISIADSRITYLDLQQQEGSGGTGLMMQLLFNTVYERAKQTENKMIFVIDEARYIMKDAQSLEFLEQAVRHSRHYNLSIQFITQTVDEFFAQEEAEAIADNCSLVQLNQVSGLDDKIAQEKLGMNPKQAKYARNATPGDKDRGYSEALLNVEGSWYPIHIKASDAEAMVVDFDPDEMDRSDLPGYERKHGTERERNIEDALNISANQSEVEEVGTDGKSFNEKFENIEMVGFEDDTSLEEAVEDLSKPELVELLKSGEFSGLSASDLQDREVESADSEETGTWGQSSTAVGNDTSGGPRVYYVEIDVNNRETDAESESMPVIDSLGDAYDVYATDPQEMAIRAGNYGVGFDAVISTSHDEETFVTALTDLDEVSDVEVADITDQIETAEGSDGGDELQQFREQTQEEEQSASNETFAQLQREVEEYDDYASIEDDMRDIEFDKIDDDTDTIEFNELVEADADEFEF